MMTAVNSKIMNKKIPRNCFACLIAIQSHDGKQTYQFFCHVVVDFVNLHKLFFKITDLLGVVVAAVVKGGVAIVEVLEEKLVASLLQRVVQILESKEKVKTRINKNC